MVRDFFHCCLFSRDCAEERSLRVTVLRVGRWQRTLPLPGHKKLCSKLKEVDGA